MFFGASRSDRVREILRYAMTRSMGIALAMGTVFFVLAPEAIGVFSVSASIREIGTTYLRISVVSYPFTAINMITDRVLQGMGHGNPALVLALLRVVLIGGPLALLSVWLGKPVEWVWVSIVVGVFITSAVALVWLRRELARLERG
jgi:Na+-driven multidrug efflux pump